MVKMTAEVERFPDEVQILYREIITGAASRIKRGAVLWSQFEDAVKACRVSGDPGILQLTEKVNELAVAKVLVEDTALSGQIEYEPELLPNGRKIDFVVGRKDDNLYLEVKTVHPQTADTKKAWDKHLHRMEYHPPNISYHVEQGWMGAKISGKSFTARARFLEYTQKFENPLADAKAIKDGVGILVFCGDGSDWDLTELEDFACFYFTGSHRQDDRFALMEQNFIRKEKIKLRRNIDHFAFLQRSIIRVNAKPLIFPVGVGPRFGAPRPSKR